MTKLEELKQQLASLTATRGVQEVRSRDKRTVWDAKDRQAAIHALQQEIATLEGRRRRRSFKVVPFKDL